MAGKKWGDNHPRSRHCEWIKCKQRGPRTQLRRSWRKKRSSRTRWARQTLQPPIKHTTHQKLQRISWRFWSGTRDHCRTERSQGPLQEVQQKSEAVHPTRIYEPWRNNCSGNITERPYDSFRHINTYSALHWWLERPDNGNDPNQRDKSVCQEKFHTPEKYHKILHADLDTVLPSTPEWIVW